MSASFLTSLDVRIMDDCGPRPKIMLLEPLHYQSDIVGTVIVPRFTISDGSSVPTPAMGIFGWPAVRAGVVHDWLIDMQVERRTAAKVFLEALAVCGIDEGTAEALYQGVRIYDRYVEQQNQPPEEPVGA